MRATESETKGLLPCSNLGPEGTGLDLARGLTYDRDAVDFQNAGIHELDEEIDFDDEFFEKTRIYCDVASASSIAVIGIARLSATTLGGKVSQDERLPPVITRVRHMPPCHKLSRACDGGACGAGKGDNRSET